MRVDVACYKVCSFSFCGLKISLIVLRVVCHFFFCFVFLRVLFLLFFCFVLVLLLFFIETDCYFREKLHTYSDASILFPSVSMSAGDDDCSFR